MKFRNQNNPKARSQNSSIDNDFASILEESRFDRVKPYLIGLIAITTLIALIGGGVFAYQQSQANRSDTASKNNTTQSDTTDQEKCLDASWESHKTPDESDPEYYPKLIAGYDAHLACYDKYPDENSPSARLSIESARQEAIDASGDYKQTYLSSNPQSDSKSTPSASTDPPKGTYDPSKCEPLNTEAATLKQSADKKKSVYDNAFNARKIYGDFYNQYGNSIDAQRAYDAQEAYVKQLQEDWHNTLSKSNAAYGKYQECRATL